MSLIKEFKQFALRGNVADMAVGIIIGAAFGKIVSSIVQDLFMPPLGLLIGNVNFSDLSAVLHGATETNKAVTLNYGLFITTVIDFIIIALVVFALIKGMNALKKKEEEKPAASQAPSKQEILLTEIRDILKNR